MEGEGYVIKYLYFSFISLENCIPKSIRDLEPKKGYRIKKIPLLSSQTGKGEP